MTGDAGRIQGTVHRTESTMHHRLAALFLGLGLSLSSFSSTAAIPRVPAPEDASTTATAIVRAADAVHVLAGESRLLLLGEFHGTREIPQLVARLVDRYAGQGPVVLGLEIDRGEQRVLDGYMDSAGDEAARQSLRRRTWWHRTDTRHDGRRSHDMLALIEHMRRLRAGGADVAVLAYDVSGNATRGDVDARDRAMAAAIRTAVEVLPRGRVLMLAGNVHAMKERPGSLPAQAPRPAGTWLRDLHPFSVRITARAGHFWAAYGPDDHRPAAADGARSRTGPATGAYDALVVLPEFTVAHLIGADTVP